MEPVIFHIDVNSAFLSWTAIEQLKNGSTVDLRTIPAIIGGDRESRHGTVSYTHLDVYKRQLLNWLRSSIR